MSNPLPLCEWRKPSRAAQYKLSIWNFQQSLLLHSVEGFNGEPYRLYDWYSRLLDEFVIIFKLSIGWRTPSLNYGNSATTEWFLRVSDSLLHYLPPSGVHISSCCVFCQLAWWQRHDHCESCRWYG